MNTISQNIEQYKLFNAYTQSNYQNENNLLGGVGNVGITQNRVNIKSTDKSKNLFDRNSIDQSKLNNQQIENKQTKNKQIDKFTPSDQYKSIKDRELYEDSKNKTQPNDLEKEKLVKNQNSSDTNKTKDNNKTKTKQNGELTEEEKKVVEKLKQRDSEVKAHEQAHLAAAGGLAKGGASYTYQIGPDGKQYAVGGEVQIDTSPGATPEETITKMQQVRRAALAPAEPSGQDIAVANAATKMEAEARAQLREQKAEEAKPKDENPKEQGKKNTVASNDFKVSVIQKETNKVSNEQSLENSKTESKFDFTQLLNKKYGISSPNFDYSKNKNNIDYSNTNEFSYKNNINVKIESFA